MDVNSFTFYRDYFELIDTLNSKDKKELLVAITDYVFKDKTPNLTGHNKAIFNTLSHQLNVSKSNSKRRTKTKPNENQIKTEKKQNRVLSFKFNIYKYIEDKLNITISSINYEKIEELLKTYNDETLCYAVDLAIQKGHRTLSYFFGIVNNWKQDNLKTLKQIKGSKVIPDWFDKEIESTPDEEGQEDFNNFIGEFRNGKKD